MGQKALRAPLFHAQRPLGGTRVAECKQAWELTWLSKIYMFCIPLGALECEIRTRTIPQWMLKWCSHPGKAPHPPTKRNMMHAKLAICCQTGYRWVDSWGVWLCMKHANSVVFLIRQLARKHYGHCYFTHRHRLVESMLLTSGFKIEKMHGHFLHIKNTVVLQPI